MTNPETQLYKLLGDYEFAQESVGALARYQSAREALQVFAAAHPDVIEQAAADKMLDLVILQTIGRHDLISTAYPTYRNDAQSHYSRALTMTD